MPGKANDQSIDYNDLKLYKQETELAGPKLVLLDKDATVHIHWETHNP